MYDITLSSDSLKMFALRKILMMKIRGGTYITTQARILYFVVKIIVVRACDVNSYITKHQIPSLCQKSSVYFLLDIVVDRNILLG